MKPYGTWTMVCALLAGASSGGRPDGAQPLRPPDIVVVMVDDLDVGSFETALAPGCTASGAHACRG